MESLVRRQDSNVIGSDGKPVTLYKLNGKGRPITILERDGDQLAYTKLFFGHPLDGPKTHRVYRATVVSETADEIQIVRLDKQK